MGCEEAGNIAGRIVQLADRLQCDRIVMGTHGRSALGDLLAGSTASRVLHLSGLPVVFVK